MGDAEPAGEPPAPPPPAPPPPAPAAPTADLPVFDTPNILWHFGALSAAVAGIAVIGEVHHSARGFWVLLVSLAFLAAFAIAAAALLRTDRGIPGGILAATAVSFVPLAGEGFERLIGVWGQPGGTATYSTGG
jgi:hypothetical protein